MEAGLWQFRDALVPTASVPHRHPMRTYSKTVQLSTNCSANDFLHVGEEVFDGDCRTFGINVAADEDPMLPCPRFGEGCFVSRVIAVAAAAMVVVEGARSTAEEVAVDTGLAVLEVLGKHKGAAVVAHAMLSTVFRHAVRSPMASFEYSGEDEPAVVDAEVDGEETIHFVHTEKQPLWCVV